MTATKKGNKKSAKDDEASDKDKTTDNGYGNQEPPRGPGNPNSDPQRIHRDYLERRLGGGAAATPEAYARALEQWRKLPGAVSTPPTEIKAVDADRPSEEGDKVESEDTGKDTKREA